MSAATELRIGQRVFVNTPDGWAHGLPATVYETRVWGAIVKVKMFGHRPALLQLRFSEIDPA